MTSPTTTLTSNDDDSSEAATDVATKNAASSRSRFPFIAGLLVAVIGLAVGIGSARIGVSKGSEWGWTSGTTVACILGGLVVLLSRGWYELRVTSPLIDLRTSAHRPILLTNIAAVLIGFGMMHSPSWSRSCCRFRRPPATDWASPSSRPGSGWRPAA